MDYRLTTLENGLRVVTARRPSRTITAVRVYVRAGSRYDGRNPGKAHFVEHILFAGTVSRSSQRIYSDIESLSGMIQANTTKEYSTFCAIVMDKYLEAGLDVLADLLINPAIFESKKYKAFILDKEKLVISEEINRARDTQGILWNLFSEMLWVKNPIRRSTLGSIESLNTLEYEQVRSFYRKRYTAGNTVISICGDMDHEHILKLVSHRFSNMRGGDELRPTQVAEPPISKRTAHIEKDIHQTHLIMGVLVTDMKDESRYAVKLLDRILGSGASSRLFRRLREEEKRVYAVYSVAPMYEDTGCLAVHASCSPENVSAVESLILDEWQRLRDEPVDDAEMELAKRIYEGTLARECETNMYVAGILGIEALLHEIEPFPRAIEKVNAVTKQDVMEAANRYLDTTKYTVVTVGNKQVYKSMGL